MLAETKSSCHSREPHENSIPNTQPDKWSHVTKLAMFIIWMKIIMKCERHVTMMFTA